MWNYQNTEKVHEDSGGWFVAWLLIVVLFALCVFQSGCQFVSGCGKAIEGGGRDIQWVSDAMSEKMQKDG